MPDVFINWWVLLATVLINIGAWLLWPRRLSLGRKTAARRLAGRSYLVICLISVALAWVLVHFVRYAGALGVVDGAEAGFWLWLGLSVTALAAGTIAEGRPWKHTKTAIYLLVIMTIDGALLAAWR